MLVELQKQPIGTEGSVVINIDDMVASKIHIGEFGKTTIDVGDGLYFAIHNHPDNGVLSPGDIIAFCNRHNMVGIESVCNNGQKTCILMKTIDSKPIEYADFVDKKVKAFIEEHPDLDIEKDFETYNAFCHDLLKEGETYGFTLIEGWSGYCFWWWT